MPTFVFQLIPLLYGACFLVLLWQAFRVMSKGFQAVPRPGDRGTASSSGNARADNRSGANTTDRTGRLTIHPELLDGEGQLTREDLLTVRFSGDNEQPVRPEDIG
ncbi:MAG: DUF2973 domain-containing protein [Cyanobacteria bacterium]|nr:DUF2973 domain-containing protein [Cyanobacteriota bacterium]